MAQKTITPYGTNGQAASGLGIVDNLVDGGRNMALSAEMGKELNDRLEVLEAYHNFKHRVEFNLFDATIPNGTPTIVDDNSSFSIVVSPRTDYSITSAIGTMDGGTLTKTENQDGTMTFSTDDVVGNINIFVAAIPTDLAGVKMSLLMSKSYIDYNPSLIIQGEEKWAYQAGLTLNAFLRAYDAYSEYVNEDVSNLLQYALAYYQNRVDGSGIKRGTATIYKKTNYNSDSVQPGYNLFRMIQLDSNTTYQGYYELVINILVDQLDDQPRLVEPTSVSGTAGHPYQHKASYVMQHWLDGLYMIEPFRALYASKRLSGQAQSDAYDDIVGQLINAGELTYDTDTHLYRHAFAGEGSSVGWADANGRALFAWGRALGWYIMAMCDVLDVLPSSHARRSELMDKLTGLLTALLEYRDTSGVWSLLPTLATDETNNKLEATSSCMYAYGYLHGVRMGYLSQTMKQTAKEVYEKVFENFIEINGTSVTLKNCVTGGNPGASSTNETQVLQNYYSKSFADNDPHGVGPFIMASLEYELLFNN